MFSLVFNYWRNDVLNLVLVFKFLKMLRRWVTFYILVLIIDVLILVHLQEIFDPLLLLLILICNLSLHIVLAPNLNNFLPYDLSNGLFTLPLSIIAVIVFTFWRLIVPSIIITVISINSCRPVILTRSSVMILLPSCIISSTIGLIILLHNCWPLGSRLRHVVFSNLRRSYHWASMRWLTLVSRELFFILVDWGR